MIGRPHILTPQDVERGIQALATYLLGDAAAWTELVSINRLAPPYLTLNPASIYGPAAATVSLPSPLSSGATSWTAANLPQSTNLVYFSVSGSSGLVAEAVRVEAYTGGVFTFSTPLQNSYPAGTRAQLFATYVVGNTQVLLPGDTLFVPVTSPASFALSATGQLTDGFGSDIASPVSFSGGDLSSVRGLSTLNQRMRAAIQTQVQSLPLHPTFGSELQQNLGQNNAQTKWSALLRSALLQLPEVANVQNVQTSQAGTSLYVTATVTTHTSEASILLQNEPFTLVS